MRWGDDSYRVLLKYEFSTLTAIKAATVERTKLNVCIQSIGGGEEELLLEKVDCSAINAFMIAQAE